MKVNIRGQIYDSSEEPILLILDNIDKLNIGKMNAEQLRFYSFPETISIKEVKKSLNINE